MDPQVILIGVAAFVISALLIYLISVFGIKEKSYEEAIAEQRRRLEEEQEKHRKDKKAEKDKKKKKPPKEKPTREKPPVPIPSTTPVIEPEMSLKEHKMVNLEIDPEIIEPLTSEKPAKPSKKKPSKPILHNKDEKPLVAKETQEVIHHIPHPKDDVELKHEHDKKLKRSEKQKADSPRESKRDKKPVPVEEEIFVERISKQVAAPAMESMTKKSKAVVNSSLEDVSSLMTTVRNAQLNDQDTQTLIEILLNKQGGGSSMISTEWNKKVQKGDPVALLRKQLEEKERSLQEEQQLAMANNNKCKELKADMVKEKARYTALETQYQEKIAAQTQEIQALHAKMRSTHDHNLIETSKLQAHIQQMESQIGGGGRLKEENQVLKETIERMKAEAIPVAEFNSLRQKVSIMENELSNNVTKLSSAEKAKKTLEQKCNKLEEDMKKSKSAESQAEGVWSKQLDEIKTQLRKTEADKAALTEKLKAAEKDCSTVKTRLQELEKTLSSTDSKDLEEKLKNVEKSKTQAENSLKSAEQNLSESERQKKTLQMEVEKLKQENHTLNTEVKTLKERPVGEGQDSKPNGDIHDETSETKITVSQHEKEITEKESQIQKLMADVESKKKEVSSLQEQMETQKKKNNMQTQSAVTEAEKNDQAILKRLFPDVKVDEKLSHKDWMSNFEKETAAYLTAMSNKATDSVTDSARVKEVEEKNKSLQSQLQDVQARLSSESAKFKDLEVKNQKLETQLSDSKNVISTKSAEAEARVKDLESSNEKLQLQLEKQKSLEESNRKLQSELTQANSLESTVEELQSQLSSLKAESEKQKNTSENRILSLEKDKKALQEEIQEVSSSSQNVGNSQITELEEENQKLKSQNQEYLSVLKVTETKLQQLENSVEGEERKWQSKAETLQIDLRQAKEELESLREQLRRLQGSEEMQEKVQNLEEQLKKSEDKCSGLQSQVNEAEARISSLQLTINKSAETDNGDLLKQIAELKASFEKEQKKSKELATQTVKLNGIIKTGHDALIQEQELVKKLQQQLEAGKEGSGTTNASKEVKELKSKLAEKEKQLDREITSNKQLSQRLAQLGVMTSSQSSLNEAGTSV